MTWGDKSEMSAMAHTTRMTDDEPDKDCVADDGKGRKRKRCSEMMLLDDETGRGHCLARDHQEADSGSECRIASSCA